MSARDHLNPDEFKHSGGFPDTVTGPGSYAQVDHSFGENEYFVMWIEGAGSGSGTKMIQHLNESTGKRPAFAMPEENTEQGNRFIASLRRRGLA